MAGKMNKEKVINENEKEMKAKDTKIKKESVENKRRTLVNKRKMEVEFKQNNVEGEKAKSKKENGENKNKKVKFNEKHCLKKSVISLKAHSKNCNKRVKINSKINEDKRNDVSIYNLHELMEVYMSYVHWRNILNKRDSQGVRRNSENMIPAKTFSYIFMRYGEWLQSFMEAYVKRSGVK